MISGSTAALLNRIWVIYEDKILFLRLFLLIVVAQIMTDIKALSSFVAPTCSKDWPGINISFLALDFDGTCTVSDTTGLFYKASDRYRNASDQEAKLLNQEWEAIGLKYFKGYQETITKLLEKVSVQENGHKDIQELKQFLLEVHRFDRQSTKNVEASGLLAGISHEGIAHIAKEVDLKPGCLKVLEELNLTLNVISFNWSKDLIQTVLGQLKHLKITGNSFPTVNNITTGKVDANVSSSLDKEREFTSLMESSPSKQQGFSVFIGDSLGDLLALLKADIGIVIGKSSTMKKVCKAFGIKLQPLSDLYSSYSCGESITEYVKAGDKRVLYETTSWQEIGDLLLGYQSRA